MKYKCSPGQIPIAFICMIFILILFESCGSMLDSSYGDPDVRSRSRSSSNSRMPSEPGKCYAKCRIGPKYETFEEEILVYKGSDVDREGVELETIVVNPAKTKWEKKKAENCLSSDPNDCVVWCLVKVPEVSYDYYVVKDTSLVKDYYIETLNVEERVQEGGYSEWREVVCQADLTKELYRNLQMALIAEGYGQGVKPDGKIDSKTKEALVAYQKSKGLPIGSLDMETLDHLGVEY